MFILRNKIRVFFIRHDKYFKLLALAVVLVIAGFFAWRPVANVINNRIAIHRFNNMPVADMISDFEYLLTAIEESWPFFNLSYSANGVDVWALADKTRVILNDPATTINCPLDFMDILHEHFFAPINQLGHLRLLTRCYEVFFETKAHRQWEIDNGGNNRSLTYFHALYHRPEVTLFFDRMRHAGRGTPSQPLTGPVMEFDILEEERIAYIRVNRMINVWDDTFIAGNMMHYERGMYNFNQHIADYEHLIIDFRENPGGQLLHFRSYILSSFLPEMLWLPVYVHYMDGYYSRLAREIFDLRSLWPTAIQAAGIPEFPRMQAVTFDTPLLYLDATINFTYVTRSNLYNIPANHYYGVVPSAQPDVLFNGKIWLLVDERTASAAEGMAALMKFNNIATLVGEATLGMMGTCFDPSTIVIALPNTGIPVRFDVAYYTDIYGRPLQGYGIQPHYPNRPGMDALETVLAMINERG